LVYPLAISFLRQ
jgi:ABC-type uncharacterized transport system fused permease/ATPase subunit